ncbi:MULTISPECIES: plasmid transfer protein TraA [unclassified Streptomyces]|uniref:plasmid transfer protein TraA n=1 Tax=unclassified Streptomyces TaxID=2593676 RepID=UPI00278C730E|nr:MULTISPECIES: plasmid transfer protein TraA [unclassified Streptomyces]
MADVGSTNRLNNRRIRQQIDGNRPRINADTGERVPPPPNYPPSNTAPAPANGNRNGKKYSGKVNINKLSLVPDVPSLPPLSFSYNRTTVVQGGGGSGAGRRATPGSGFTSDEDIRAYCESLRKEARPRAVERALDSEVLESALRSIPDQHGSMAGSRARARRVTRHLKRIAAAEKLISKQASALWATFTREFQAELAQISSGRRQGDPRVPPRRGTGTVWKNGW